MDIKNVNEFFGRARGAEVPWVRDRGEGVWGDGDREDAVVLWLAEAVEVGLSGDPHDPDAGTTDKAYEKVLLLRSYIPRLLNELFNPGDDGQPRGGQQADLFGYDWSYRAR